MTTQPRRQASPRSISTGLPPEVFAPSPEIIMGDTSSTPDPDAHAGVLIDRALINFRGQRVANRRVPKTSPLFGAGWLQMLSSLDEALVLPPIGSDLGAFVRSRVTLEVELDADQTRGVALPKDLRTRIAHTLRSVDDRVRELRLMGVPGTLAPTETYADDVLVLHKPVTPWIVTSPFGVRIDPLNGHKRFHAGVDIGAPFGSMVYSAARGVVIYAGWQGGYGRHVVVDHGSGIRTHYSHMHQIFVQPGEILEMGDTIGAVGATGRATGPHLHWAVTNADGQFLDPLVVLDKPLNTSRKRIANGIRAKKRYATKKRKRQQRAKTKRKTHWWSYEDRARQSEPN